MRVRASALIPAAWLAATLAHAQNADFPPPSQSIVVTATRRALSTNDVAAGVEVVDAATIAERGYTTLADALSAITGAHLVQSGGAGANASLFLRGADSDQVQVLMDGVPVGDPSGPGGAFDFGVDTLADVARIEIVRGPMSAVYGSGAIGGVVNIITARGAGAPRLQATIAGGIPGAMIVQTSLRGASGAFDYSLSGEARSDRGFDATPARERVYNGERDGYRTKLGSASFGWTPLAGTRLFVNARGRATVSGYDDVGFPAFDDPNETARTNDSFIRSGIESALFDGVWNTALTASFHQTYRRYTDILDDNDPNQAAGDSRYFSRRADLQWNNVLLLPDTGWSRAGTVLIGYQHDEETARERLDEAFSGYPYRASVTASERREAGYLGLTATALSRLALTANLRVQSVPTFGSTATWRLGASLAMPEISSHLKASYGTAFLTPSLYDRYGTDSAGYQANPALRPEQSQGFELGWVGGFTPALHLEVTYFRTQVTDLIQTQFAPVYTSINIAQARLQGIEATLRFHPMPWIDADAAYNYTDARDTGTGTLLLRRPYNTGTLTLTLRPLSGLTLVPQLLFAGGDRDARVNDAGYPAGDGFHAGGAFINLNASYRLTEQATCFFTLKNLAGSRYEAASGYAAPGTFLLAGISLAAE